MQTIQNYKCPCCGGMLVYKNDKLCCESCGNDFDLESIKQLTDAEEKANVDSKYDWEHYTPRDYKDPQNITLSNYSCPSCGAEISGDDTLGATVCPYCGNANIIKGQFDGTLCPDYIIPFKLDKKSAVEIFEKDSLKAPFLPEEFKVKKRIEEMAGIYIPFWMFDCDCNADLSYNAQRISHWSDADFNYTKTDYFKLFRSGSIEYANIPVDGSKKADDTYMEAIEPFDYHDAVNFSDVYLSGYLADKYDVSAEESIDRANERVKNSTVSAFNQTTYGYTSVFPDKTRIDFSDGKIRYSLLPVWMLSIKYKDQIYKFAINGQTGKIAGKYPVDKSKRNRFFAKAAAIGYAFAAVLAYFLLR